MAKTLVVKILSPLLSVACGQPEPSHRAVYCRSSPAQVVCQLSPLPERSVGPLKLMPVIFAKLSSVYARGDAHLSGDRNASHSISGIALRMKSLSLDDIV